MGRASPLAPTQSDALLCGTRRRLRLPTLGPRPLTLRSRLRTGPGPAVPSHAATGPGRPGAAFSAFTSSLGGPSGAVTAPSGVPAGHWRGGVRGSRTRPRRPRRIVLTSAGGDDTRSIPGRRDRAEPLARLTRACVRWRVLRPATSGHRSGRPVSATLCTGPKAVKRSATDRAKRSAPPTDSTLALGADHAEQLHVLQPANAG